MGCWNGTCAISNLPILNKDKVKYFFLVDCSLSDDRVNSGFCQATQFWSPRGAPISGQYNDYGGVKNVEEDLNCKIILQFLKEDLIEVLPINKWDISIQKETVTLEVVLKEIKNSRIQVSNVGSKTVGSMMVLEDIYNTIVDETIKQKSDFVKKLSEACEEYYRNSTSNNFFTACLSQTGNSLARSLSYYNFYLESNRDRIDRYELVNLIDELKRFLIFNSQFVRMRKFYFPQSGAGSQEGIFGPQALAAHATLKYLHKKLYKKANYPKISLKQLNEFIRFILNNDSKY